MKKLSLLLALVLSASVFAESPSDYVPKSGDVYRHGYGELTKETDKKMYNYVLSEFLNFKANATISDIHHKVYFNWEGHGLETPAFNDLKHIFSLLDRDVPELFIMYSYIPGYDYTTYEAYGRVIKQNTPESYLGHLKDCESAYNSISKDITADMSEYEIALKLHDGFIDWADYGDMTGANAGNIRGALVNKKAVCEGFARAYLYLCQRAGLNCIYVTGSLKTKDNPETWGNHAWNYVQIDGTWYLVDTTADGGFPGVCGHVAFLKGQEYYKANYKVTYTDGSNGNVNDYTYKAIPEISKTDYEVPTSVQQTSSESKQIVAIYSLAGQQIQELQKGINIVKYSDGSAEKVMQK